MARVVDFSDVPNSNGYYNSVIIMAERGITAGCGGGNYCPNDDVTRAQMAVFLLRAQEGPAYSPPACTPPGIFADVSCPSGFAVNYIEELYHRGITGGCQINPLKYCPNDPVTRASMAVFLLKTLEGSSYTPPPATGTVFLDVHVGDFAADFIEEIARRGITSGCGGGNYCPTSSVTRGSMAVFIAKTWGFTLGTFTPAGLKRFFFYTPELNLIAESEYTTGYHPLVFYEHFWLAGAPVAEVDTGSSTTHWTLTDHLGTPILQTSSDGSIYWRVEDEPYGKVWTLRAGGDNHQPLRLPGQEAEQFNLGINGATERSYNIFRWYRYNWGRYTQSDPVGLDGGWNLYAYSSENPVRFLDPDGRSPLGPADPENFGHRRPNPSCCSPDELGRSLASVERQLRRIAEGLCPSGRLGGALVSGYVLGADGRLYPVGNDSFRPYIDPSVKDPCSRYCVLAHEATHRLQSQRPVTPSQLRSCLYSEGPAYTTERRCLQQLLQETH